MQALAVPFYMNDLTDSNAWVGAAAFAVLVPALLMTPVAGIWADRISRKTILFGALSVQLVATSIFLVLFILDLLTPWLILLIQVMAGLGSGFQWAPTQAMAALLVPPKDLLGAVRCVSLSFTAGRAVGPVLAGLILYFLGPGPAFAITILGLCVGLIIMSPMQLREAQPIEAEPFWQQFRQGVNYIRQRAEMRLVVATSFLAASLGTVFGFALVASVADDVYFLDDGGLAWLTAAFGFGSLAVGLYVTSNGDRHLRSRTEMLGLGLCVLGLLLIGSTSWLILGLLGYFILGAGQMAHGVTVSSALQVQVDENYRGRVMSVWLMSVLSGLPIGSLIAGFLGDFLSVRFAVLLYGGLLAAFWLGAAIRSNGFSGLDIEAANL